MGDHDLRMRTKQFALRVLRLVAAIPSTPIGRTVAGQLVRCGTAVGANYRATCKSRSRAEFIARISVVEEEADESAFWMEMLIDGKVMRLGWLSRFSPRPTN
jgi:four helix bundle protein